MKDKRLKKGYQGNSRPYKPQACRSKATNAKDGSKSIDALIKKYEVPNT